MTRWKQRSSKMSQIRMRSSKRSKGGTRYPRMYGSSNQVRIPTEVMESMQHHQLLKLKVQSNREGTADLGLVVWVKMNRKLLLFRSTQTTLFLYTIESLILDAMVFSLRLMVILKDTFMRMLTLEQVARSSIYQISITNIST